MTTEEKIDWLKSLPSETISPQVLAVVAGGDPYSYNIAAKNGQMDLPHFWRGRNLRIWKGPVIRLMKGGDTDGGNQIFRNNNGEPDQAGAGLC